MRVLVAHNAYQQRGGEDLVAEAEVELLRRHGHEVQVYQRHNDELAQTGRLQAAMDSWWSRRTVREMQRVFADFRPDVLHVHNTFPLISPSLYGAAAAAGCPVVQTLHNFRLLCPQAMLLREGRVCERCVGRSPWPAVVHACYRQSRAQTAVLAGMLQWHRHVGTWSTRVHRYIALTAFSRDKFIAGGLPAARIVVKPNFVDLPAPAEAPRRGLLFVGRLAPEKGLAVMVAAAGTLPPQSLRVAGSGPLADLLQGVPSITARGALDADGVNTEMAGASALVLPSICYENFPRTLVEAYANGLPVLASRLGAMAELVEDGVTGLLFEAGDAADLASKMRWVLDHPEHMATMGRAARARYEARYTGAANHAQLMRIYAESMAAAGRGAPP